MKTKPIAKVIIYIACLFLVFICVFPYFWMLSTSFKSPREVLTNPPHLWPHEMTIRNYYHSLFETEIPRQLFNSIVVSFLSTAICILFSSVAGYALAWFSFRGKNFFAIIILCCQMVPGMAVLLPLFLIADKMYLTNSLVGLSIIYQILVIPFCTWMFRGFFATIPREIEEAAQIDGCTKLKALWRIVLPISSPGIFVTAIFSWMVTWEEFLFALTFTRNKRARTIPVGIDAFIGQFTVDWGAVMASSIMMSLPILILFFFFQDKYIKGIAGGAVKG